MANKKNSKKQVNTNKVEIKTTTPAEEEIKEDVEVKADNKATAKASKEVKSEAKANKAKQDAKKADSNKKWFKEFKAELKKVVWPTGKELFNNTSVVLMVVIIVAVLIFLLDLLFGALTKFEVKQIEKLQNNSSNSIVENVTGENQVVDSNSVITEEGTTEVDLTPSNN